MIPESELESKPGLLELESESCDAGIGIRIGIKVFGKTGTGIRITCYWNRNWSRNHGFFVNPGIGNGIRIGISPIGIELESES